jgi:hypothetical protein
MAGEEAKKQQSSQTDDTGSFQMSVFRSDDVDCDRQHLNKDDRSSDDDDVRDVEE